MTVVKAVIFRTYPDFMKLILFKEFLSVVSEEKFTVFGGKLFQTLTTRSLN